MYARVVTFTIQPSTMDRVLEIARGPAQEAMQQQVGFSGWLVLADREKDLLLSIPQWETEADMMASDQGSAYLREQMARIASYVVESTITHYEVAIKV